MPVRLSTLLLTVLAAAPVPWRQAATPAPSPRESTVAVEFFVIGQDRLPVRDLKADEVTIRIDGRARTIRSLKLLTIADPPADPLVPVVTPPPLPFGSNAGVEGRTFILVIDDESFRPGRERTLRAAVGRLLGALSPRDRVSLVTVPHGGLKTDFTTNHDRIAELLAQVVGHGPQVESGSEGACRTRSVLESVEGMLTSLAGGEGPTVVLFVSAGLYAPRRDAPATMAPGMCELTVQLFQRVGGAASQARAHFFIIQPDEQLALARPINEGIAGVGFTGSENPLIGLEHLGGVTGGRRITLSTAAGDAALVPIARETTAYYSAVIETTDADFDGLSRGVDVRIARGGAELRARPQLYFPKINPNAIQPAARSPQDMIRESRTFRDLALRVTGYASAGSGDGRLRILAVAEPVDPSVTIAAFASAVFDAQGRLVGQFTATSAELAASPVLSAFSVPAGVYRLRVAAVDASGRAGTADVEVTAELVQAGSLRLSSLVVGLSRGGTLQPRLQFTTEPVALGYLDLYGGTPGAAVSAVLELATSLNGPAILTTPLTLEATNDPGRFSATGAIPLASLPAGDYVVRAIVGIAGQPAGRVVRTIRKT
jgi:hypothetical protein